MKKQKQKDTVYSLPAVQRAAAKARVSITSQHQSLQNELTRLDGEHKRSYEAAKHNRLLGDWMCSPMHINDEIINALWTMRGRSRELYQNNAHVQNYFQLLETHVVGSEGYTLKSRATEYVAGEQKPLNKINDVVELNWKKFCARGVCDITGKHSMQSLLTLVITTVARDGEAILRKHLSKPTKKNPFGLSYQLLTTERLDATYNAGQNAQGISIIMGVEVNEFMRPIAYHLSDMQANQSLQRRPHARERVLADDLVHVYAQEHAEQLRGVPWLNAVMMSLHQLQSFEDYTLVAARIGAAKTGFFTSDREDGVGVEAIATGIDARGDLVIDAEPGMFQALPPGVRFEAFTPDFPAATFEAFVKAIKRSIANGLRIGYNTLFQDLSDVNYSSIRQDLIASRDMWKNMHTWMIESVLEVIYEDWIKESFKHSALVDATGYRVPDACIDKLLNDYVFHGRSFPQIDPKNDLESMKMMVEMGIISRPRIAEMLGEDIYANGGESAEYRDFIKKLDLQVGGVNDPVFNLNRQDRIDRDALTAKAAEDALALEAKTIKDTAKASLEASERARSDSEAAYTANAALNATQIRSLQEQLLAVSATLELLKTEVVAEVSNDVIEESSELDTAVAVIENLLEELEVELNTEAKDTQDV